MKVVLLIISAIVSSLCLAGCESQPTVKNQQAQKAAEAANSIRFTENAEIDNIKRRLQADSDPGRLGFILLLNDAGQPILYEGVKGKVTSGGKRLTPPDHIDYCWEGKCPVRQAPSDEGTFGASNPYIFYWNVDGVYRQWSGQYLYADQPIRLRIEPLIVGVVTAVSK